MSASLIERLPAEEDPQQPMEERLMRQVAVVAYVGTWWCKMIFS